MTAEIRAFWTDDYDRTNASDGVSRFGFYLRDRAHEFRYNDQDDPAWFATRAFEIAQSPIMSPPYVHNHPRIVGSDSDSDEDGRRGWRVNVVAPLPDEVFRALPTTGWRGWEQNGTPSKRWWCEPYDLKEIQVLTGITVRIPLPPNGELPKPVYHRRFGPDVDVAKCAIRVLVAHFNAVLQQVLAPLERPEFARGRYT